MTDRALIALGLAVLIATALLALAMRPRSVPAPAVPPATVAPTTTTASAPAPAAAPVPIAPAPIAAAAPTEPTTPAPPAPAAGGAFIRAEFLDGGVVLRGVVPDEATRQRLRRDAAAIYGPQNVRSRIALDPALAPAPWLNGAAALAPARMLGVRRATLDGATLLLEGEVASGPARERALAQARAAVPRSIRVVSRLVVVPPAGSAPAAPVRELRAEGR
jgi:hypothetical protein